MQLVSEPTRVTKESETLIDHVYTNNEETVQRVCVEKICISDHFVVFCNRKAHTSVSKKVKSHRVKKTYQLEWLTPEILDCIKERKKCKLNGNTDAYKKLRNKVTNLIDVAKKKTYQSKIEEGKSDPRTIWKLFKEFGINCKGNGCENNLIINESDLAELFDNYFVNVASKLKEPIIDSEFERLNNFVQSNIPSDIEFKIPLTNTGFVKKNYQA